MNVEIFPTLLNGKIEAVSSKSDVHRTLIACALSDAKTTVRLNAMSDDIRATMRCLNALGAEFEIAKESVTVTPVKNTEKAMLDCGESGSTLRFLMPVAAALCPNNEFSGHGRLPQRPIDELRREMEKNGCTFSECGEFPVKIKGKLRSGAFSLPGNVSSQYITGLLFALPLLEGDSIIQITSPLQSKAYVDMTLATLAKFSINIERDNNTFRIKGKQKYISPKEIASDGDWSNAAFWLAAGAIGNNIAVSNLNTDSLQGDKKILDILCSMGAKVEIDGNTVKVSSDKRLTAVDIDAEQIPDLVPILAVTALFADGKTRIFNAERLRIKECDRLSATSTIIKKLGGTITEGKDFLEIYGNSHMTGGIIDSFNDHRIVMSAAICATLCGGNVTICNAEAVNKSYPSFFEDYKHIGGNVNVIDINGK